jgi:hypothetical protein
LSDLLLIVFFYEIGKECETLMEESSGIPMSVP